MSSEYRLDGRTPESAMSTLGPDSLPASSTDSGKILELDGVRAISIVFVLLVHLTYGRLGGGFLGVDVFFVLSGYLITMLLLREFDASGTIDLPRFYMRRVLRILPPLVVAVTLAVILAWGSVPAEQQTEQVLAVLLFYSNLMTPEFMGNLAHTWSLAVEEQFYLAWPALLLLSRKFNPRSPAFVAVLIIIAVVLVRAWMVWNVTDRNVIYTFTFSRLDGIMLGSLMAVTEPTLRAAISSRSVRGIDMAAWGCAGVLIASLVFASRDFMQSQALGFLGFALVSAAFIFTSRHASERGLLRRGLRASVVQWLGQRSYGLYLYHYPIFSALESWRVPGDLLNFAAVAFMKVAMSLVVTELAWRVIEQPILAFKKHFHGGGQLRS